MAILPIPAEKQERDDRTRLMVPFDRLLFFLSHAFSFLCLEMFACPLCEEMCRNGGVDGIDSRVPNLRMRSFGNG